MLETSARLLALLGLLQSRPTWTGAELATRLGVTTRTVRNDVERLRTLDYPVEAVRGSAGHYRLGAGARLPPLLLDDEEAVAVAVGLRAATGVAGVEDSSTRALRKLEQVLPHRLRRTVAAIGTVVDRGPDDTGTNVEDPDVDAETLARLARAVRDSECVRFRIEDRSVLVEPYRVVSWQRRWFLVGRDPTTGEWHPYRLDRTADLSAVGRRFAPDPLPGEDYTALVVREVAAAGWQVHARVTVHAPAAEVVARINDAVGVVEPVDDRSSVLVTGADSVEVLAVYLGMLGLDFSVDGPDDLLRHLSTLAQRYARAAAHAPPTGSGGGPRRARRRSGAVEPHGPRLVGPTTSAGGGRAGQGVGRVGLEPTT